MTHPPTPTQRRPVGPAALLLLALAPGACAERGDARTSGTVAREANGLAVGVSSSEARFAFNIDGFQGPESVRYDPEQDAYFVSNMTGFGSVKDGNGYISRVPAADGQGAVVLVQGGKDGAELHAPKGMAIQGDTLWVADIDVLRAFHRRTGAPLAAIDFAPRNVTMLNDVAVGPDGTIRVTDTGILMTEVGVVYVGGDRIFAVGPSRAISVVAAGPALRRPNGITWDGPAKRWIVVSFDPWQGEVAAMAPGDSARRVLRRGGGKIDGVEVLRGGGILFASWADSSIHLLEGGRDRQLIREVPEAADIGVDTRRNRVAIPLSTLGRVQLWSLDGALRRRQ